MALWALQLPEEPMKTKNTYSAKELHFCGGQENEAIALVKEYHYSHRAPGSISFVGTFHLAGGLFGDQGECVAACFFSTPPTRWSEPVLELTRLVRKDGIRVPLSRLVGLSCKHLKKQGHDLLVSFADSTQGHEGYIYRACSWNYHGKRNRACDGLIVDGEFIPGRTCVAKFGTRSASKLKEIKPAAKIEQHFDEGKHLYWRALNKAGEQKAERLALECNDWRSEQ